MPQAHAKINLGLRILGRRADGYHSIETVFHRIALCDDVHLAAADNLRVTSSSTGAPEGEANICYSAARLLQEYLGVSTGVHIHIDKAIPVGAGLGGGSADAAVVLEELPRLWGRTVTDDTLRAFALKLGSDVPFFLGNRSALARGRGEQLTYVTLEIPFAILTCHPNIHVSTAWAYQTATVPRDRHLSDLLEVLRRGLEDLPFLRQALVNDFEPTVFAAHPAIRRVKDRMLEAGAVYASMSGSGSSVYAFFRSAPEAEELATAFRQEGFSATITPPGFVPA